MILLNKVIFLLIFAVSFSILLGSNLEAEAGVEVPGSIEGTKWNDLDGDGVRDAGEPGLPNWEIEIGDGKTTTTVLTDANGDYSFSDLANIYTVTEVLQLGWVQTFPTSGSHMVILGGGQVVQDIDFGNVRDIDGPAVGGELIPVDSTSLLVAGAQTNAAWMIPVIVSAIGIGIVIARKF